MKVIIFLVLAGLSLAAGNTNPSSRWECLFSALQKTPSTLQKLSTFICEYRGTFDNNKDKYVAAFKELKATLEKAGCHIDEVLGTEATIEDVAEGTANAGEHAAAAVLALTGGLGLNDALTGVLCKLAGDALTSGCLANILANLTPDLIKKLDKLFCKSDLNALSAYDIFILLQNIGCFADDALGSKDTVQQLFELLGDSLAPLLANIVKTLAGGINGQVGALGLSGLTCKLLDVVSGTVSVGDILSGAGSLVGFGR